MKYLVLALALFCNFAFAACPAKVAVSPQLPDAFWCERTPTDPRDEAVRAYVLLHRTSPQTVFSAMVDFGVTAVELADVMRFDFDVISWMRLNGASAGLGGLKVWDSYAINQWLIWAGYDDLSNPEMRTFAQAMLDKAARREELYLDLGMPRDFTPWSK